MNIRGSLDESVSTNYVDYKQLAFMSPLCLFFLKAAYLRKALKISQYFLSCFEINQPQSDFKLTMETQL